MRLLLYSGVLYLAGIALVLVLKPAIMFREDGSWKEFGIGRNPNYYTWFTFWIFAFVWAIASYILMVFLANMNILPGIEVTNSGEIVNNTNISGLVYNMGEDSMSVPISNSNTIDDFRHVAEEMTEVPLQTPDVSPIITDIHSLGRSSVRSRPVGNLKNGYYILNTDATRRSGIPKYIFLGPEPPRVLYH